MRIPVAPSLSTKDGLSNKNARLTNTLKETTASAEFAVVRPGLSLNATATGVGQGLVVFNDELISVYGTTLGKYENSGGSSVTALFYAELNGSLTDSVGHVIIAGASQGFDTVNFYCGTNSYKFDTTGAVCEITVDNPDDFGIGTQDFTIEAWVYPSHATSATRILDYYNTDTDENFGLSCSGAAVLFSFSTIPGLLSIGITGLSILNTWTHVAVVRLADVVSLYVNGVLSDSISGVTVDLTPAVVPGDVVMYFGGYASNMSNILFALGAKYIADFAPVCVYDGNPTINPLTTVSGDFFDFAQSPL